ncbi:MAG: DNA recombination protein RmuC [Alphaproteobacteria bacterium]|jgi:DNA recombination protein RmuC|nr:DNA recombination protein RmuC [Alphaproteobacteria bacterium]MBT5389421.1 DNA recombination protein RmuC [Alphaproteobacteria bacterium]MBT5540025.1 DNA recombination protein RmuC [Alphaproteobacteria bacterium]MBT5654478.1 DNA recombination protein RmuC [Alphaproteobacteria bacterium]
MDLFLGNILLTIGIITILLLAGAYFWQQRYFSKQTAELREKLLEESRSKFEAEAKTTQFQENQKHLSDTFRALSADALQKNNQSFMDLAKTTLEKFQTQAQSDLKLRQNSISEMMTPMKESLKNVDTKIQDLEKARVGAYAGLKQQVHDLLLSQKELRSETSNLVKALRTPHVRGRWGEMQLRRVVEMAGMQAHCDFVEQVTVHDEDKRLRPDMVVNMPGGKKIIIDAKAPLSAYLEAIEADDDGVRLQAMKNHVRQIRTHITALSSRAYWDQFEESPEFVVLFLPGEPFFSAALEQDPTLIEVGVEQRVIIATPTTLISLLRAASYGWRQERLEDNAREISELGKELYKRLSDMGNHMGRLGRSLGGAVESYNQTVGTMERRVLVSARKFKDLGATAESNSIDDIPTLTNTPRTLEAPEVTEQPKPKLEKASGD